MNTKVLLATLAFLALFAWGRLSTAQEPAPAVAGKDDKKPIEKKPADKVSPDKKPVDKKLTDPAQVDVFDQSLLPRTEAPAGFNPHMMGDLPGTFARRTVVIFGTLTTTLTTSVTTFSEGSQSTTTTTTTTRTTPTSQTKIIVVPVSSSGAFKVSENSSPRPVDRVFMTWNYFGDIHGPQFGPNDPLNTTTQSQTRIPPTRGPGIVATTDVNTFVPAAPPTNANLNREVFGFEKTFFDGNASLEIRVPLAQLHSSADGFSSQDVGDLTIITKYAFINNRQTGNVLSGGLSITVPTGPGIDTIDGSIHSTLLQPWFGYIWNADRFFVHAFHSVVVPTDSRDVTLLFNDVGLNYWLYRNEGIGVISSLVPMLEAHVTTPLNHRNDAGPIVIPDLVVLTGGLHIGIYRNTTLSLGVATPISGPRLYNVEGFVQLNWHW
jgi:hypothetical protein